MKMVNLTTYELRLTAGKRGIKNYKILSREKLLNTQSKSEESEELERFAKMQNLSQNELEQVTKMQNQSRDELEQITK